MKRNHSLSLCVLAASLSISIYASAEETAVEKAETQKNKISDGVKKTYRAAKDQACPIVNGQMKCLEKKIEHKIENLSDKAKTTETELKNKSN